MAGNRSATATEEKKHVNLIMNLDIYKRMRIMTIKKNVKITDYVNTALKAQLLKDEAEEKRNEA